jgi:hypothetical protein
MDTETCLASSRDILGAHPGMTSKIAMNQQAHFKKPIFDMASIPGWLILVIS